MNAIVSPALDRDYSKRDALAEHVLAATRGALEMFSMYIGDQLGFYTALAMNRACTPAELPKLRARSNGMSASGSNSNAWLALCRSLTLPQPQGNASTTSAQVTRCSRTRKACDTFDPNATGFEWLVYGFSILHCLPVGMADSPALGTGTVMRTSTFEEYARQAGFSYVEVLNINYPLFRFCRLGQHCNRRSPGRAQARVRRCLSPATQE